MPRRFPPRPLGRVEALEPRDVPAAPTILGADVSSGPYLNIPTTGPAVVSGTLADPTDPAATLGARFLVGDAETPFADLVVTATSDTPAVVPDAGLVVTGTGLAHTLKITPAGVGRATITVTVTDGENLTASYVINYAASAASATPALTRYHVGVADHSAAVAVDDRYMWVAGDEDQKLRLFDRAQSGLPLTTIDFTAALGLTEIDNDTGLPREVDIEAVTRVGNTLYWIGSMSNRGDAFRNAPNRSRVFATTLSGVGANSTLTFAGHYDSLLADLKAWDDGNGAPLGLSASEAAGVDPKTDGGLNLEGLTMAPGSSTTAYLGFRAPIGTPADRLADPAAAKALLVPVTNFPDLVTGAAPVFGTPFFLDLNTPGEFGPRGIRSMETNGTDVLIVAGPSGTAPADAVNPFRLFKWDGDPTHAPRALAADLAGQKPEALVAVPDGALTPATVVQLISDDGTTAFYGDGVEGKAEPQPELKKGRSDLVTLGKELTDLSVTIDDGRAGAASGTQVTYSVTVTNYDRSSARGGVVLAVGVPAGLQNVTYTPSRGSYNSVSGLWTFPGNDPLDFAGPGRTNTVVLTVSGTVGPAAAGPLTATASVALSAADAANLVDTVAANDTASDTTLVPVPTDLSVTIDDGVATAAPGAVVTYTVTVRNNDVATIHPQVNLALTLPPALQGVTFTPSRGTYDPGTGLWQFPVGAGLVGSIVGGQTTAVLTVNGTVAAAAAPGDLTVSATVAAIPGDPSAFAESNPANNTAADTDTIPAPPTDPPADPKPVPLSATSVGTQLVVTNADGSTRFAVTPFAGFAGSFTVARGDVNGDGVTDILTGAGAGGAPHVKVFDGATGGVLFSFYAFGATFPGGVNVALGDLDGDGRAEIVVAAGPGGGPHVKVFDPISLAVRDSFFAYGAGFQGGVNVAAADVTGDGLADIVTGSGAGSRGHVKAFDGAAGATLLSFFAYDAGFAGGAFVAAGDLDGDGRAEIVTGAGPGALPQVAVFAGATAAERARFLAYDASFTGGVRAAVADADADGSNEIVTAPGPGGGPNVKAFDPSGVLEESAFGGAADDLGGVFVA